MKGIDHETSRRSGEAFSEKVRCGIGISFCQFVTSTYACRSLVIRLRPSRFDGNGKTQESGVTVNVASTETVASVAVFVCAEGLSLAGYHLLELCIGDTFCDRERQLCPEGRSSCGNLGVAVFVYVNF
jgi:hypothetical protein